MVLESGGFNNGGEQARRARAGEAWTLSLAMIPVIIIQLFKAFLKRTYDMIHDTYDSNTNGGTE